MALIQCKNCGREISDKAAKCPGCGAIIIPDPPLKTAKQNDTTPRCRECGLELPVGVDFCPNCGCPAKKQRVKEPPQKVEITSVNIKVKKNTKKILICILSVVIVLLAASIVGVLIKTNADKKMAAEKAAAESSARASEALSAAQEAVAYVTDLRLATYGMLSGSANAEKAGNLIKSVWYNCIFEKSDPKTDEFTKNGNVFWDDFNIALDLLFADPDFTAQINAIKDNQDSVGEMMKKLQTPPSQYAEAYETIKSYYRSYLSFTNVVLYPQGNLQTFSTKFNETDSESMNWYKAMEIYIDE